MIGCTALTIVVIFLVTKFVVVLWYRHLFLSCSRVILSYFSRCCAVLTRFRNRCRHHCPDPKRWFQGVSIWVTGLFPQRSPQWSDLAWVRTDSVSYRVKTSIAIHSTVRQLSTTNQPIHGIRTKAPCLTHIELMLRHSLADDLERWFGQGVSIWIHWACPSKVTTVVRSHHEWGRGRYRIVGS